MMTIFALVASNVFSLCLFIISFFFFRFSFSFLHCPIVYQTQNKDKQKFN